MKLFLPIILFLCLLNNLQAQAPEKFKYQAVARDQSNQPYSNTTLRIRFALVEDNSNGAVRYSEEHLVTTSALGVFEAAIGDGTVLQGSMNNVSFGDNSYFLRVELNPQATGGNFILMGTSQLLSVPYALYAEQSGSSGNQTLDLSGNELSISNGNSVTLPEYQAGSGINISGQVISAEDDSDSNELQLLDLNGNQLSISDGNSVTLPGGGSFNLPYTGSQSSSATLFTVNNSGSGGAIHGITNGGGDAAIIGEDPSGGLAGVRGYSSSSYGVLGFSDSGFGILGQSSNVGIKAESSGIDGIALQAHATGPAYVAIETQGEIIVNTDYHGIYVTGGSGIGLTTTSSFEKGVMANGDRFGIVAQSSEYGGYFSGDDVAGVFAFSNGGGYAGNFQGKLYGQILEKGSGSFKIDHPLDPENKFLYHSFVESPDMMNVYNGNVTTDEDGFATVILPDYFEALNRDFRYQLTTVGTFAQVMVEREVSQNTFRIQSDKPNVKVSWQVTGIRKDAHANEFRIVPTVEKEEKDKGKYLCPECYQEPEEKGIYYADRQLGLQK